MSLPPVARPRRPFRRVVGAALALLIVGGGILTTPPAPARAESAGGLVWGLKASWRSYVPAANQVPGDGASKDSAGLVTYPVDEVTFDAATGTTEARFSGSMHYQNWCGIFYEECALDLVLRNPRVVISPDEQTLYATVESRARGSVNDGVAPAIIHYGEIAFARLDASAVTADGGVTSWSGILAALGPAAVPAIGYDAGTALDLLAFSYGGPGGRPVVDETWTPAGSRLLEETHRWTAPSGEASRGAPQNLFVDSARGVVHLITPATAPGSVRVQALDAADLAPLASAGRVSAIGLARAFDPVTGTVFLSENVSGTVERLLALTYDPVTESYSSTTIGDRGARGIIKSSAWDPVGNRLVTVETRKDGTGFQAADLVTWSLDGGTWSSTTFPLIAPGGAGPADFFNVVGDQVLAVAADGSIILGKFGQAVRITLRDGAAITSQLPVDAADQSLLMVLTGTDGSIWTLSSADSDYVSRFRIAEDGSISRDGPRVAVGSGFTWGAVDPDDGTLWLKAQQSGELVAVEDGAVTYRETLPGLDRSPQIAVGADALFTAFRDTSQAALARLDVAAVSPTVTESPAGAAVGADAGEATFSAAATGSPAPGVRWQAKQPGATRFLDVPGAKSPDYSTAVTAEANGTQYRAVFTNPAGSIATDAATLTVLSAPTIVQQPLSQTVTPGTDARFQVLASGTPEPAVTWQEHLDGTWTEVAGDRFVVDGGNLTISGASRSTQLRAVAHNELGDAVSDVVTLTVTPVTVGDDGSVTGLPNTAGAQTKVKPGIEVPILDAGAPITVSGTGFTKNTNEAGAYALFGYVVTPPSAGGSAGAGYDFLPGGGGSGQLGQLFIAWPGNDETGGEANGRFSSTTDGEFSAEGLIARASFTGQSGAAVDCLDGTVVCGVLTIGAHGGRDADLETFTPVYFTGQQVPSGPVAPPTPPTAPPAGPVAPAEEGSLTWGVKASFRNYIVSATARGAIALADGASGAGGAFRFGQVSGQWDAGTGLGTADYAGSVRFTGHGGILDLTLAGPSIRIDSPTSGTLLVTANGSRLAIGTIDLSAASRRDFPGGIAYSGAPVSLTADGAEVFSYGSSRFYSAGTAMDAVSFVIGAASTGSGSGGTVAAFDGAPWTPPAEPPATTGIHGDPAALAALRAGQQVTVWADGFQPHEQEIKVVIYSDPLPLELNLTADARGRATWTGTIPLGLEPGVHTLTFQGSVNRGIVLTVRAAEAAAGCPVQAASLTWGFKESFRSYISGTIAHGEWAVREGATYETPEFGWPAGSGTFDPENFSGTVDFAGSIRFTGHDGLLDTTIANPRLHLVDDRTAYLLLDVSGPTMEAALNGTGETLDEKAVSFVELDLRGGSIETDADGTVTVTGVPTTITGAGFAVFPNYEAGTAFDPIAFTIVPGDNCAEGGEAPAGAEDEPVSTTSTADLGWLWWVGALVLVIAVIAVFLLRRRSRSEADA